MAKDKVTMAKKAANQKITEERLKHSSVSKSPGILKSHISSPSFPRRRSEFPPSRVRIEGSIAPPDLGAILFRFNDKKNQLNDGELVDFVTLIKKQPAESLINWLHVLQTNAALLKPELEIFVTELLKLDCFSQEETVVVAYRNFLLNLVTANMFYIELAVRMLVNCFFGCPRKSRDTKEGELIENKYFENIHETIKALMEKSPLSAKERLIPTCCALMPYIRDHDIEKHNNYIKNLIKILGYLPSREDRLTLLTIIIYQMVRLDSILPNLIEEDDEMKITGNLDHDVSQLPSDVEVAEKKLDYSMQLMFDYIKQSKSLKSLYKELVVVFESHILTTYATSHVQFLIFYLLGLEAERKKGKTSLSKEFLSFLFSKFQNPNTSSIIRQSTMSYMSSFMTRAKFFPIEPTIEMLKNIASWVHHYLNNREDNRKDYANTDLKIHGPFYSACQSLFYIFAFHHREFATKERMDFLRTLNLPTIITSSLNPLRVCMPTVVQQFSAISRKYQLVYCDTIIERNNRINLPVIGSLSSGDQNEQPLLLDEFFPFDTYELERSKPTIFNSMFRVYQNDDLVFNQASDEDSSTDDELENMEINESQSISAAAIMQDWLF